MPAKSGAVERTGFWLSSGRQQGVRLGGEEEDALTRSAELVSPNHQECPSPGLANARIMANVQVTLVNHPAFRKNRDTGTSAR